MGQSTGSSLHCQTPVKTLAVYYPRISTYPVINPDMIIINVDLYPFNPNTLGQYIANGN